MSRLPEGNWVSSVKEVIYKRREDGKESASAGCLVKTRRCKFGDGYVRRDQREALVDT